MQLKENSNTDLYGSDLGKINTFPLTAKRH